jgi:multicomponent K+:H+ antiporter subunit A
MGHVHLPLVGEVHLGTPLLFDAGVFSLVFGATLLILVALAHQSIRARRRTRGE